MPETETQHPLGALVTDVHECFGVFKSYDGNAPDAPTIVCCATLALAEEVAAWLEDHDPAHQNSPDDEEEYDDEEDDNIPWDFCDGWEWCARYDTKPEIARADKIITTFTGALKLIRSYC